MRTIKYSKIGWAVVVMFAAAQGFAAPTAGDYINDQTQSYVNDATSQGLQLPNTVLCYMHATGANLAEVLNVGNYLALADKNKCEKNNGSANTQSGNSGSSSAPNYLVTAVNASRADNNSPLIGKVWFRETALGDPSGNVLGIIYAKLSATQSVSTTSPYGQFHTDFCGLPDSNPAGCTTYAPFYGYAEGNGASITAYQTHGSTITSNWQDVSVKLTGTVDSGSGRVKVTQAGGGSSGDWKFAYNTNYFHRADSAGTNDQCFDRSLSNAQTTAWSYGVYNADGSRLDRTSGFPIKTASGDNGYIGYWGLWLPPSVTVNDGDTVTRFSYSNNQASSGSYTVVKKDGRLHKQVLHSTNLGQIKNVPIYLWVNTQFNDSGNTQRNQGTNLEVHWNGTGFVITGTVGNNGTVTPDTSGNTIPATQFQSGGQWSWSIFGYSQSIGGGIQIAMRDSSNNLLTLSNSISVSYRTETIVAPGSSDWPSSLVCISNCPAGNIVDSTALSNVSNNPYISNTQNTWQPTQTVVTYTSSGGVLVDPNSHSVAWTGAVPQNTQYSSGIQSGQMVSATDLSSVKCNSNGSPNSSGTYYCSNLMQAVTNVYMWETGGNSWNKYAGLSNVTFDPPLALSYSVSNSLSSTYGGANLILQYNGFGDLQGVPGKCVDPVTNADANCSNNTRWVSAFTIPAGDVVTDSSNTQYYVKPLQEEIRLTKVSSSNCTNLTLPTVADSDLPNSSGWTDPTSIGARPSISDAPKVIDGVLQ